MPDVRELPSGESHRAAAALLELRPHLKTPDAMAERVDAQRADGYRVAASFDEGDESAAAVAGFRIGASLAWGRYLYVDDLVTRARPTTSRAASNSDYHRSRTVLGGEVAVPCTRNPL